MSELSVKERMIKRVSKAEPKGALVSPERAIRLGLSRAFEEELGWRIGVIGVGLVPAPFEETLAQFDPDWLTLELRKGGVVGFIAIDEDTRSAIIEVLTCHSAMVRRAAHRQATAVDAALVRPILAKALTNISEYALGTEIEDWLSGVEIGGQIEHEGQLESRLKPHDYQTAQVSLDFGVGERQGQFMFVLGLPQDQKDEPAPQTSDLAQQLAGRVRLAPVTVEAVLHRFRLAGDDVAAFKEGTEIPLDGADLGRVGIFARGSDRALGNARLGQINGMKAVRLEPITAPLLDSLEIAPQKSEGPPDAVAQTLSVASQDRISLPPDP